MTWLLITLTVVLALALAASWHRRVDLRRQQAAVAERAEVAGLRPEAAPLQLPVIDLSRCLGCGTCVASCPETGVLALVHGQAAVINGAACVGHARCVAECPVGAVTLGQADLSQRRDVPVLDDSLEATGTKGLFLIGEVTARSLIRVASRHGAEVAATIAARCAERPARGTVLDAVIVGAGPAGFACALGCREHGLAFELLDQEPVVGGTVAKYPRRKLVLTEAIELPLHGPMPQREYAKEELIALWQQLASEHEVPFRGGVTFERVERQRDGTFLVHTDQGPVAARHVVLAIGRRGMPKRLGVPGEDLPHVAYSLLDAAAYQDRHVVVVGGGDSAVETALALAEQPGNQVTIVHRGSSFARIRSRNRARLEARIGEQRIDAVMQAEVAAIGPGYVELRQGDGKGPVAVQLRADDVLIMIGGTAPQAQLEQSGVSFDPAMRAAPAPAGVRRGGSLLPALAAAATLAAAALGFVLWHLDYYGLSLAERAAVPAHALLRPDRNLGLAFGIAATAAIVANLAYLLRRNQWLGVRFGQLATWMTAHVGTGVLALVLAVLHAAMSPRGTPGGYAFWALVALFVTGAIGRWFYAWLPRSANGRELELATLRAELARATAEGGDFARRAGAEVQALIDRRQWRSTLLGRAVALVGLQWDLWLTLRSLRREASASGVSQAELLAVLERTRSAHGLAVAVAHLEDLRGLLGTWRWLHRWLALLMVLLVVVHVVVAVLHGVFSSGAPA